MLYLKIYIIMKFWRNKKIVALLNLITNKLQN